MSTAEWKDEYDANAAPYVTHESIKENNKQQPYPEEWANDVVEGWFTDKGEGCVVNEFVKYSRLTSSIGVVDTDPSSSSSQDGDGDSLDGSSTNIGAIAGGAVGGVAILIAIAVGVFICIRKRRRNRNPEKAEDASQDSTRYAQPYTDGTEYKVRPRSELDGAQRSELYGEQSPVMLQDTQKAELPAGQAGDPRLELPG